MTVADYTKDISAITNADPCVVTTSDVHGYSTNDYVRITNLGLSGNFDFGCELLDDKRFKIVVLSTTTFSLKDPLTGENIDSTNYSTYVSNGKVNLIRTLFQIT
jgi:hypothetical protein